MIDARRTEAELHWHASPLTRAVATCAGIVLAAALIGSRWQLIAFVAPLLGVLCSIGWQKAVPNASAASFWMSEGSSMTFSRGWRSKSAAVWWPTISHIIR